jgi:multiple sugar transport system permease protein
MQRPHRRHLERVHILAPVTAWAYAIVLVFPLYYLFVSSFKDNLTIFNDPLGFPIRLHLENYRAAWDRAQLGGGLVNSTIVTVAAELVTLALAIPAAYGLSRATGRLGTAVERFFSLGFLIPTFAALVPTIFLALAVHLFQTRQFLVLYYPATALPLSVIILTQFMRAVPRELEESAALDGAGRWQIMTRVFLPLIVPGVVTVAILNFLSFWNEYLFALILGGSNPAHRTVQVALPLLVSQTNTEYGVLLAGALITMAPVYVVYFLLQRRMSEALIQGAIKG